MADETFEPYRDDQLYFGNEDEQKRLIDTLRASIAQHEAKLHMVTGEGSSIGKTSAIEAVREKIAINPNFIEMVDMDARSLPTAPGYLPVEISEIMHQCLGESIKHAVYKDKNLPFYVVIAETEGAGELAPAWEKGQRFYPRIAQAIQEAKKKNYTICWIADAPVLAHPAPIFKVNATHKIRRVKQRTAHDQAMAQLSSQFPETIVSHNLHYDMLSMRQSLWEHLEQWGEPFAEHIKPPFWRS